MEDRPAPMPGCRLAVVFISCNSARELRRALLSLAGATAGMKTQVVVVENGADASTAQRLCAASGAELVLPPRNLGYGVAANLAAMRLKTEYLAVANPDVAFEPDTILRLVEFLDSHPEAGVVAPQLVYPDGTPQPSARRRPSFRYILAGRRSPFVIARRPGRRAREFQYLGSEASDEPLPVEAVVGAFMLFRRRAFDEVCGFDPRYFMFAEDIDICLRLAPRWGVYLLPGTRLVHAVGSSRRRVRPFTEFHRLRSLRRLFRRGVGPGRGLVIDLLFTGYLALTMAGVSVGVGEREPSWQSRQVNQ